jgi:ketosteroid isomerase-like protein
MPLLFALILAADAGDVAAIKQQRARSNAAIAAHEVARLTPVQMPDYAILPGSSGKPLGAEELAGRLGTAFQDPSFVTYVRTPERVRVSSSGKRAAETGRWVGTWRKADGEMRLTGVYQAMWVPGPGGWGLQNESFVTLRCTGSRSCPEVD